MAKLSFVTHILDLNILLLSRLYTTLYITKLILQIQFYNLTISIPITPSDTDNYLASDAQTLQTLWFLITIRQNNKI